MNLSFLTAQQARISLPDQILSDQDLQIVDPSCFLPALLDHHRFPEDLFDDLIFVLFGSKIIRAVARPFESPAAPPLDRIGIDFLRMDMAVPRLTTSAAMTWGHQARHNLVELTREQCEAYLRRENFLLTLAQRPHCSGRGSLLIRFAGKALGLGFLEILAPGDPLDGRVRSLFPRAFSLDLEQTSALGNPS